MKKVVTYFDCPNCSHVEPSHPIHTDWRGLCVICGREVPSGLPVARPSIEVEGKKHDSGKPRFELLPPEATEQIVNVLTKGQKNTPRGTGRKVSPTAVFTAALQRHLNEFWKGNSVDPEWGLHHLAHAGCCLLFLLTYEMRGMKDLDDRPRREDA